MLGALFKLIKIKNIHYIVKVLGKKSSKRKIPNDELNDYLSGTKKYNELFKK